MVYASYYQKITCATLFLGAHLRRDKTYEKVAERFYWPQLSNDVKSLYSHEMPKISGCE